MTDVFPASCLSRPQPMVTTFWEGADSASPGAAVRIFCATVSESLTMVIAML